MQTTRRLTDMKKNVKSDFLIDLPARTFYTSAYLRNDVRYEPVPVFTSAKSVILLEEYLLVSNKLNSQHESRTQIWV